jgi:hypothetical protein
MALAVLIEVHERVAGAVEAGQLLAVAVRAPRVLVAGVRVDGLSVELDPYRLTVRLLVVVQVHRLGAAVADAADLLALRDELPVRERGHGLEVDVVGGPTPAVVEEHPVLAS